MAIPAKKEKRMPKVFIIAEAGVNHNGSLKRAKKMVDAAILAGADAIKFQSFDPESLACVSAPKAGYQKKNTARGQSQLQMLKRMALTAQEQESLVGYCRSKKITFISSPFDLKSIGLLAHLRLKIFKIPSGEITNLPYLRKLGSLRKEIIISTGMANLEEIKTALNILLTSGTKKKNIIVLHCNTAYPTPFEDVNLFAMTAIKDKFKVRVGYSDHTVGIEAAVAAAALGAGVIEKHFTLNRNLPGPDHKASLTCKELGNLVAAIRNVEKALGSAVKAPSKSESKNIGVVRKSIVASCRINKGEYFSPQNLTVKRPGNGISPMKWDEVVGKKAKRNFNEEEQICL